MSPDQDRYLPRRYVEDLTRFSGGRELTVTERKLRQQLKRTGHELRREQHEFAELDPNTQVAEVQEIMAQYTGRDAAKAILVMHNVQDRTPFFDEEGLGDIAEPARLRLIARFQNSAAALWPWAAIERKTHVADDYMKVYDELAGSLRLFPRPPELADVPNQRLLRFEDRALAAQLLYIEEMMRTGSYEQAGAKLIHMATAARNSYEPHGIEKLRETVSAKISDVNRIAAVRGSKLWNDIHALSAMCTDRGIRDAILGNYHVLRSVSAQEGSGYSIGQELLSFKSTMRDVVRTY